MAAGLRLSAASNGLKYKIIFFGTNGLGPYTCYFCNEQVTLEEPQGNGFVIHHINENQEDNNPKNLAPAHHSCHTSFHNRQRTNEFMESIAVKLRGKKRTSEQKERISRASQARPKVHPVCGASPMYTANFVRHVRICSICKEAV